MGERKHNQSLAISRLALTCLLAQLIASCGGGGGGTSALPPPPPPPQVTFSVGGFVEGLVGSGVTLGDSEAGFVFVTGDGAFALPNGLPNGTSYSITVSTQPVVPSQTCTVQNGAGTIQGAAVSSIVVACVTNSFQVGGTASGIGGATVDLQLNGGSTLALSADGSFAFGNSVASGTTYTVTVSSQPKDVLCTVLNGTGTMTSSAVSNIAISCAPDQSSFSYAVSNVTATDLAWEPHSNRLYLSMSSLSSVAPNSVVAFDPVTGTVTGSAFVGSEPASLSPSDDGASLYVGFSASQLAQRLALPSLAPNLQVSTVIFAGNGPTYSAGPQFPLQVAAAPGATGTFALSTVFTQSLTGIGSIIVYDSATPRWQMGPGGSTAPVSNSFAWGADAETLLSTVRQDPGYAPQFFRFGVSTTGWQMLTEVDNMPLAENGFTFAAGLVYGDSGTTFIPESGVITGHYLSDDPTIVDTAIVPDVATGRTFIALDDLYENVSVHSFNLTDYTPISIVSIPTLKGRVKEDRALGRRWAPGSNFEGRPIDRDQRPIRRAGRNGCGRQRSRRR